MGMYDRVNYECECPNCKSTVTGFQSKDNTCELKTLNPSEVHNFYSACDDCNAWIEFDMNDGNPVMRPLEMPEPIIQEESPEVAQDIGTWYIIPDDKA